MGEVALALAPIVAFFLLFQVICAAAAEAAFPASMVIGLVYTYVGLVLFLDWA